MSMLSMRIYHGRVAIERKVWSGDYETYLYKYRYSTMYRFRGRKPIIKHADMRVMT